MTLDGAMGPLIVLLISVLVIRWLMLRGRFSDLERQVKELASARDESVSLRANLVQRVFALEQERKKTAVPEQTPARAVAKELAREAPAPGAPAAEITPLSVASAESAPAPPVEAPTAILGAAPWLEPLAIPDVQAGRRRRAKCPFARSQHRCQPQMWCHSSSRQARRLRSAQRRSRPHPCSQWRRRKLHSSNPM